MTDHYIYDLPPLGALTDDDLFYVVNEPAGAATSMKITALAAQSYFGAAGGCVTHTCGATGWRASGGTTPRTLVHETAFQLDTGGNARGAYAVDLQQVRWVGHAGADVAAADYSAIYMGEDNVIHPNSDYSAIIGLWNELNSAGGFEPYDCQIIGNNNVINGQSTNVVCIGSSHNITNAFWAEIVLGLNNTIDDAFGCMTAGEQNVIQENVVDYPTYSFTGGLFGLLDGDVFGCFQFGEDNEITGDEPTGGWVTWDCFQVGYRNQAQNVIHNYMFGDGGYSGSPSGTPIDYYDNRFVFSGDYPNDFPSARTGSGYNQDSWFSRSDLITTWNVAWTNSFEFPIISDSIWFFEAYIVGTEQGCTNSFTWKIEGVVENDGGTTTILSSTVTNVYRDVATKEWQVVADDPNDRLVFQFRDTGGPDATDCNIQMSLFTMEVGFN